MTDIMHEDGQANVLAHYSYTYDGGGRLASETDNGVTMHYAYDASNQLTVAGSQSYSYDANGNRTLPGYQTGPNNQLASDGTWNYTYDAAGNVIARVGVSNGLTWSYTWDNANHLTTATEKENGVVVLQVTLTYDVFGNRVEEDATGPGTAAPVTHFRWDGPNVWAELDGNSSLTTRRMYGDGPDQPLARVSASGAAGWYLADHLGSVRAITDSSGAVQDQIDYDAYGMVVSQTNAAAGDAEQYAGYHWDVYMGLDYTPGRWYAPDSGRWYSQDPLGFAAGDSNLARYVGNGPTNAIDPTGLDASALLDPNAYLQAGKSTWKTLAGLGDSLTTWNNYVNAGNMVAGTASQAGRGIAAIATSAANDVSDYVEPIKNNPEAITFANLRDGANYGAAWEVKAISFDLMPGTDDYIEKNRAYYNPTVDAISYTSGVVARECILLALMKGSNKLVEGGARAGYSVWVVRGAQAYEVGYAGRDAWFTGESAAGTYTCWKNGDAGGMLVHGTSTAMGGWGLSQSVRPNARSLNQLFSAPRTTPPAGQRGLWDIASDLERLSHKPPKRRATRLFGM